MPFPFMSIDPRTRDTAIMLLIVAMSTYGTCRFVQDVQSRMEERDNRQPLRVVEPDPVDHGPVDHDTVNPDHETVDRVPVDPDIVNPNLDIPEANFLKCEYGTLLSPIVE